MKVIIDRFEEDLAVVELDEKMYNVPRALFPEAQEGDTVEITVLGKIQHEDSEEPHAVFERLRKKRRGKKAKEKQSDDVPTAADKETEKGAEAE